MEEKEKCACKHGEDCDCQHEHDEHCCEHDDCCCDGEDDVVILQDEQGNDIAFHHIYTAEYEGKDYVYLQAVECEDDDDCIEIFELQTSEEDGEEFDNLYPVEDDLYEKLYNLLMEAVENEADECDCGCHHHHHDDDED